MSGSATSLADEEMVRAIIEQAVDVVEARRKREGKAEGKAKASWPAWLALALSAICVVFAAGVLRADVAEAKKQSDMNRVDIIRMQESGGDQKAALARIEAKVDILMGERKHK